MSLPILYSYFRSSASYRVRIALALKEVGFEYRPIHLLRNGGEQYSQDYLEINPMGQVPCFVHNNQTLSQSMAIIDYIDQQWPHPHRLFPEKPWERAQVIEICELVNSGIQPLQNVGVSNRLKSHLHATDKEVGKWNHFWISKGLEAIEKKIELTVGSFSFGEEITAVDLFIIPQVLSARRFGVHTDEYPNITRVDKACSQLKAFQKASPTHQPDTPAS